VAESFYMKLCVDRDLNCGRQLLYEAVCRQIPELRPSVVT
jgi:hypothetical protein